MSGSLNSRHPHFLQACKKCKWRNGHWWNEMPNGKSEKQKVDDASGTAVTTKCHGEEQPVHASKGSSLLALLCTLSHTRSATIHLFLHRLSTCWITDDGCPLAVIVKRHISNQPRLSSQRRVADAGWRMTIRHSTTKIGAPRQPQTTSECPPCN